MNKLFIHQPLFRLISPLFSGSLVYLLVLLLNNNVGELNELFLGEELYLSIGLSYVIQEGSRILLYYFERQDKPNSFFLKLLLQGIIIIVLTVVIVSTAMQYYYEISLGYSPSFSELKVFCLIFVAITIIYITLSLSHQLLHLINTQKVSLELEKKESIREDYQNFIEEINPALLFEGLEALLVQIRCSQLPKPLNGADPLDLADDLVGHLSMVYRYMLNTRNKELVPIQEEIDSLDSLVSLYNSLPYRLIEFENNVKGNYLILPGILFQLTEYFIKSSIRSNSLVLKLTLEETDGKLIYGHEKNDRVGERIDNNVLIRMSEKYRFYSDSKMEINEEGTYRKVFIPKIPLS